MSKINLKSGVSVNGIQPEILVALQVAASCYAMRGYGFTLTSVKDGVHSAHSLHYVGLAIDCRIRHLPPGMAENLHADIARALGNEFDVVLESTHIHIEFDPKYKDS